LRNPEHKSAASLFPVLGLACAAALILFAWLAAVVLGGHSLPFDDPVRTYVHEHSSPALTTLMRMFTALGTAGFFWVASTAVTMILAGLKRRAAALRFAIIMAGAGVLDTMLKLAFHRPRPAPFFNTPLPHSYSFPSGHALLSLCLWGTLAALLTARSRSLGFRIAAWALAVSLIGPIGFSRIYLGVHYPSDVLAGYAAGLVWVTIVAWGERMLRRARAAHKVLGA
jgi:undecaprenyl-diphosphatase